MSKRVISMVIVLVIMFSAVAAAETIQRTVTVRGEGKVSVAPDEVMLSLGVEVENRELKVAKEKADTVMRALLNIARKAGISESDIKTDYLQVHPRQDQDRKIVYMVVQNIQIVVKELTLFDSLLKEAIDAGANRVHNVTFRTSQYEELKTKAMLLAIENAKARAGLIAQQFGMQIGKPFTIADENTSAPISMYKSELYSTRSVMDAGNGSTLAIGEITVMSQMAVTFELEAVEE